jgi:hypothetical protein
MKIEFTRQPLAALQQALEQAGTGRGQWPRLWARPAWASHAGPTAEIQDALT